MSQTYKLKLESIFSESERVLDLVDQIDDDTDLDEELKAKMQLVLSEAVTNSIVHGNRENPEKSVTVIAEMSDNSIIFKVTDEGEGFDHSAKPDPTAEENLLKTGGRGIFIIEEIADKVEFEDRGRTVVITFLL
ncbi:MAG TPA: ATP-binding protein [Balneolaceae bacterium]|nr:ATP-binding protein [Balneolaceae bacterium]